MKEQGKTKKEFTNEFDKLHSSIFSHSPVGIELYDSKGLLVDANAVCLELFGITDIEEVRDFSLFEDPNLHEDLKVRLLNGEAVQYESEFDFDIVKKLSLYKTSKSGKCFLRCFITPLKPETGTIEGFLVHVIDITRRKKAEAKLRESEERYRTFIDSTMDISFLKDENFHYLMINKALIASLGREEKEIIGKTDFELMPQSSAERCKQSDIRALESEGVTTSEDIVGERIYETRKFRVKMGKNKFGIGAYVRDVTERKEMEDALNRSHKTLINVLDGIDAVVYAADMKTYEVLYMNKHAEKVFGNALGKICWQAFQTGQTGPCGFCTNDRLLTPEGKPAGVCRWEFQNTANGKWYDIHDRAIPWIDGRIVRLEIATDITELKQAEESLRSMSFLDDLTGLHNRRGFMTLANQQLKIAHRDKKGALLIFADLDNMKWVNDTLGHLAGDQALIDASRILKETFRESDIIARISGDEFVILAMEAPDVNSELLTKRLLEHLDAFNAGGKRLFNLSLSIGIVQYDPERPSSIHELLYRADELMYKHKQEKKKILDL